MREARAVMAHGAVGLSARYLGSLPFLPFLSFPDTDILRGSDESPSEDGSLSYSLLYLMEIVVLDEDELT